MASAVSLIFWSCAGYVIGSCPTGYILVRALLGEDIRNFGSGNTGATNVSRVLGAKWGIFTAIVDMLKGAFSIVVAMLCGVSSPVVLSCVGVFAVCGHDFPVWLGFRGGKGVATSFAVIAFWDLFSPMPAIIGGLVWFAVREKTRYVSAASILGLSVSAICVSLFMESASYFAGAVMLTILTAIRHKENIMRLIAGTENKAEPVWPKISRYIHTLLRR